MRQQWNSKQRFSLRKFSTGLASVLLATMFMGQGTLVQADEAGRTADNKEEVVQPKNTNNETTVQPKATEDVAAEKVQAPEQPVVAPEQPQPTTTLEKEKIEEPKVTLNTTKLEALIKEVEGLDFKKYTEESVKELNVRLEKAKDALVNAKSQKEIDSAYNALVGYKNSGLKRVPKLEENNTPKPDTTGGRETVGKKAENTEPNGTNIAGHNHSLNGTTRSEGSGFRDAGQPELTDVTMGLWSGTKYYSTNIYVTEPGSNVKNNNIKVKVKSASDPITELTVTGNDGFTPAVKKSGLGTTEADLYFEGTTPNSGGWAMKVTAKTAKGTKTYDFGVYYTFNKPTIEKPTDPPAGVSKADYDKMTLEKYLEGKANSRPTLNVTVPSAPPMPANAKMKVYLVHGGTEYRFDEINAYPEGYNIIARKEVVPGNTTVTIESKDYDKDLIAGAVKALTVIELNGKSPEGRPDDRGSFYSDSVNVTAPKPKVDKTALNTALSEETATKATAAYYNATTDKKTEYDNALKAGQTVKDKANATQEEVTNAVNAINTAKQQLNGQATDKTTLNTALSEETATKATAAYYNATKEKKTAYDNAIASGKAIFNKVDATQTEVNAAVTMIANAKNALNGKEINHSQSDNDMKQALLAKKEEAKMLIEQEAMKKKAEISQAELSESEKALLDARVDQEQAKAFQMIDQATTIEEVNQVLKAGIEAIRSIAVASANGRMTDVTPEESEAAMAQAHRQALPQTGTGNEVAIFGAAASAILAGLGLVVPSKKKED